MRRPAIAFLLAIALTGAVDAPRWQRHSATVNAPSEVQGCTQARARAAEHARSHMGLNVLGCSCRQGAGRRQQAQSGQSAYQCRVEYEVLQQQQG